jgi:hypothetical protein
VRLILEKYRRQRGEGEIQRIGPAVVGDGCGFGPSHIAIATAAVFLRIAVAYFLPKSTAWCSHPVIEPGDWSKITYDEYQITR